MSRHVLLDGNKVGDRAAAVADRRNRHFSGIVSPVLAPIDELAVPNLARKNRLPKFPVKGRVLAIGLQYPRVLANDFFRAVLGHPGEGWVDVLNRA